MTCTTMAVLCGGKGTRLGKLTEHTPKSLVEVAGRPFLEWPLEHWAEQGIQHVVLLIGYFGGLIEDHFGEFYAGMRLTYIGDTDLGHQLKTLEPPYWWTYGDTYLPIPLREHGRSMRYVISNDGFACDHPPGMIDYGLYYEDGSPPGLWFVPKEQRFYEINTPESLRETDAFLRCRLLGRDPRHTEPVGLESDRRLPDHPA